MTDEISPQARMMRAGGALRSGSMSDHLPEWIGRLIERVEATGRQMDVLGGKLDRMDKKLEGEA